MLNKPLTKGAVKRVLPKGTAAEAVQSTGYQPPVAGANSANGQPSLPNVSSVPQQTVTPTRKEYINSKITTLAAEGKFLDFVNNLTKALPSDYAMVHGCGGKGHAPNSTIRFVLCDYSNGTGESSRTVKYAVDVGDIAILHHAAMNASCGMLPPGFSYVREKNDPYKRDDSGYVPVIKITINYTPTQSYGKPSAYPWFIGIENFRAPAVDRPNGTISHDSTKATNKSGAFINVSASDFAVAMDAVVRFIRLWEYRQIPVIDKICTDEEKARQERRNAKQNG